VAETVVAASAAVAQLTGGLDDAGQLSGRGAAAALVMAAEPSAPSGVSAVAAQ